MREFDTFRDTNAVNPAFTLRNTKGQKLKINLSSESINVQQEDNFDEIFINLASEPQFSFPF